MKRLVSLLILGLIVLLGTSFTEAYNHIPEGYAAVGADSEERAEFEKIYMNPVDYPQQEGDLRIFKEVTQKHRTAEDDVIAFINLSKNQLELELIEQAERMFIHAPQPAVINTDVSLFLRNRSIQI